MANIQDKIAKLFPEATFEEGEFLLINIPDEKLHDLCKTLRDDAELSFDYLVTIVGMDWTDSLGCVYYLASTKYNSYDFEDSTTGEKWERTPQGEFRRKY